MKMGLTVLTRIVLLQAVISFKILMIVGQYNDCYQNYGTNYDDYDSADEGPKYDECHFYDDDHELNGNCFHKSFPEDEINDKLKCCDSHKYIFEDHCRGNNGNPMCGDPLLSKGDPIKPSRNPECPQHCVAKFLNKGRKCYQNEST